MKSLSGKKTVSIVIPIFNEIENIELAWNELKELCGTLDRGYEVVFVDDGSSDGSQKLLRKLSAENKQLRAVFLRRNFGQTAAMHAGIQYAGGDYIVTMDGDLQNEPSSIPKMLEKLDDGFDLVHGWRRNRKDKLIGRKLPSWLANRLISKVIGYPINDLGCTLKAMKAEIAKDLELYGEMHRFIPILASNLGARCVEMEVGHRARQFGESKYGLGRTIRVFLDLITIKYMTKYFASPMKFFGLIGFVVSVLSIVSLLAVTVMKLFWQFDVTGNPLTFLSLVCAILGIQFFSLGLIGELSVRIYYGSEKKKSFHVRELVNFDVEQGIEQTEDNVDVPAPAGLSSVERVS